MSNSRIEVIMERIAAATSGSKIAVFQTNVPGEANAVFDDTAITQFAVRNGDATYIGSYDRSMDKVKVRKAIEREMLR